VFGKRLPAEQGCRSGGVIEHQRQNSGRKENKQDIGQAQAPGPLDLPLDQLLQAAFGQLQQPDLMPGLGQVGNGPAQVRICLRKIFVERLNRFKGPGVF
jgi:hypothetical protein